jgi:hypothetical protein
MWWRLIGLAALSLFGCADRALPIGGLADGAPVDAALADLAPDTGVGVDAASGDATAPRDLTTLTIDSGQADTTMTGDAAIPDLAGSDDLAAPDLATPDLATPDLAVLDLAAADLTISVAPDAATAAAMCIGSGPPSVGAFTCHEGVCGNGMREYMDICNGVCPMDLFCSWRPRPDLGACCYEVGELCDGSDLGGATCQSLGYAGGNLQCGNWCGWDASRCDDCAPDPHVTACRAAPVDAARAVALALANNGVDIGAAWVTGSELHFARFSPNGSLLADAGCIATTLPLLSPSDVAVAPTSSGWIVATRTFDAHQGDSRIEIFHLLPDGTSATFVQSLRSAYYMGPLIARGGSGPLLSWIAIDYSVVPVQTHVWFTGFAPDGTTASQNPAPGGVGIDCAGVDTGDGVLLAATAMSSLVTFRIDPAGMPGAPLVHVPSSTEQPQLAWTGTDARLTWSDFAAAPATIHWVRLDHDGNEVGTRVSFASYYQRAPITTLGNDSVLVLPASYGGAGQTTRLDVGRLDANGGFFTAPFAMTQDPNPVTGWALARVGTDVIVGWLGTDYPGRLAIAHVAP